VTVQRLSRCVAAFLLVLAGLVLGSALPTAAAQMPAGSPATYTYEGADEPSVQTHSLTAQALWPHSARSAPTVSLTGEPPSRRAPDFAAEGASAAAEAILAAAAAAAASKARKCSARRVRCAVRWEGPIHR
jgi:hypothetical protein